MYICPAEIRTTQEIGILKSYKADGLVTLKFELFPHLCYSFTLTEVANRNKRSKSYPCWSIVLDVYIVTLHAWLGMVHQDLTLQNCGYHLRYDLSTLFKKSFSIEYELSNIALN